jgi:membrane protease subunit HflC
MFESLLRHPMRLLVGVLLFLVILSQTLAIIPEDKQALVLRFGEIERTNNVYKDGEQFGQSGAGLLLRMPFVDNVQIIDKRILGVNMERQQVLSTDQQRLQVDAFARFRITDPVRMFTAIRTEERLEQQLATILGSSLRNELGKRTFATLLSPERGAVMDNIQVALDREARKYGAEIIDVRIKRADLPEGVTLEAAYNRMRTAREQ